MTTLRLVVLVLAGIGLAFVLGVGFGWWLFRDVTA